MPIKDDVFKFLTESKGEPLSGESIASALGVSRGSIWKAIKALKEDGFMIEASTNKGYTLVSDNNVLSSQSIKKYMKYDGFTDIIVLPIIDSTNDYLKKLATKGAPQGTIAISEEQTAGKGRLGRRFESPKKTGIYISFLFRPTFSAEESLSITTVAAVSTAKAVEEVCGKETKIKWVNDVYFNEKKICGILTEASVNFEGGGLEWAVLGIGINVKYPENGFPEEIRDIAGAIYDGECGDDIRCRIIAALIDNVFCYYNQLPGTPHIAEYRKRSMLDGREVSYTAGNTEESGVVKGVDDKLRLIVETKNGEVKYFSAGEVSLKKSFLKR